MSVDVVTNSYSDPVHTNGGQCVVDAFKRIYGVDIKRANALMFLTEGLMVGAYLLIALIIILWK